MIPKELRLYVGGDGPERKVLLENKSSNTGLLFQGDVCAELHSSELSTIKGACERVADVYASIGVLSIHNEDGTDMRYLGLVTTCNSAGKLTECEIFCVTEVMFVEITEGHSVDRTAACKKLITQGTFFFGMKESGESYDITVNMQSKLNKGLQSDFRFLWNRSLFTHPLKFVSDHTAWFVNLICGSVSISTIYCGTHQARAAVISRVSSERAGARFQVRGVDDNGCVANFVETEQCTVLNDKISSFIQIRGSVPVFWEQSGIQVGSHKLAITRGYELTQVAYDKHMTLLKKDYGLVMILNLLSNKPDTDESHLSNQFQAHQMDSVHEDVMMRNFDYHAVCKGNRTEPIQSLYKDIETFVGFSGIFCQNGNECIGVQEGVLRTNCLDCIDRTNSVQTFISNKILVRQLEHICAVPQIEKFSAAFDKCWHTNANLVSRTYCGTGALKTATGKMSRLTDATRSVKRTIQNNFLDDNRQEAIEEFLMYPEKPLPPVISKCERFLPKLFVEGLLSESRDYCSKLPIRVAVGTWNSNGGKILRDDKDKLADWLLDAPRVACSNQFKLGGICDDLLGLDATEQPADLGNKTPSYGYVDKGASYQDDPDVIAIGLQELVDLTAGNIVSTSQRKRGMWSTRFQEILCRDSNYILLSSRQLVGVCLFVFIKANHLQHCTDICIDAIKTGLKGKTGNKGGVAISFNLYSTSLCFVCAHLAAGQNNVIDRNKHYEYIRDKALFDNGMEIEDHDYVFWCGDFNYRIDYANHEIRDLVKKKSWYDLQCADQLTVQKNEKKVFQGYNEGPLEFAPTYKYDLNSDYYDTSEKFRSPAWCDRVLWRCKERCRYMDNLSPGKLLFYGNTEIKTSDHRPVLGVVDIEVRKIDPGQKLALYSKVFRGLGPPNPTVCVTCVALPGRPVVELSALVTAVLQEMQQFGPITLVRVPEGVMHFTFQDSVSAMHALQLDETEILYHTLDIHLKSTAEDWNLLIGLEPTPINFVITPIEKLLDDGFVDMEGDESGEEMEENIVEDSEESGEEEDGVKYQPTVLKSLPRVEIEPEKKMPPARPPPPSRPPPPKISSQPTTEPSSQRPPRPTPPPPFSRADLLESQQARPARPAVRPSAEVVKQSQPSRPAPPPDYAPSRPTPPPEYAPIITKGARSGGSGEDYSDYRENDPPSAQPTRPTRPVRPGNTKMSFIDKTRQGAQGAKEFIAEKLFQFNEKKSEIDIGEPFGFGKTSNMQQFDDGTYKITLEDGRVIVYEKGGSPVMSGSPPPTVPPPQPPAEKTPSPGSSRPPRPATRPSRPVRPPDSEIVERCMIDPEDLFGDSPTPPPDSDPPPPPSEQPPPPPAAPKRPVRPNPVELSRSLPRDAHPPTSQFVDMPQFVDIPLDSMALSRDVKSLPRDVIPSSRDVTSLTRDFISPSRDVTSLPRDVIPPPREENETFCNPLLVDDPVIYSVAANASSARLEDLFPPSPADSFSRSATISSFDNTIYAESDPRLRHIKSQGDMGSIIDLTPPPPNQYDNIGLGDVETPLTPARPNRPPRPTRPANI
ncbi:synaptojanin-1-like isoform X3 [Bolinopsis microptera]|uniref:synaptojanin-1-like isoform X3 n=1 Tax=Bolinopsis microptera TaxID=2820187 RepID=UPI00307A1696